MSPEKKKDLTELIETLQELNAIALTLVQNSADTLLTYQRMHENGSKSKGELVQQ